MKQKRKVRRSPLLSELELLALDCQATGPNPEKNSLLELGWTKVVPGKGTTRRVNCFLISGVDAVNIPPAVSRVTGLKPEDFENAFLDQQIWQKLIRSARRIANKNELTSCPLVIHFARFERPYLEHLNQRFGNSPEFPFTIICTHQIARRIFTTLPRKGIRAVAGYLGYGVGEMRRSAHHVLATAHIWRTLVPILKSAHQVSTLSDLQQWLAEKPVTSSDNGRTYPMPDDQRKSLPDTPGIYRMLRDSGDVLYVGKATSLKKRVNSYFQKQTGHAEHILEMLSQARRVRTTTTVTALEAALLENGEIKKHRPPYNKALRRREREIHFFSADLSASATRPGRKLVIGPVPTTRILNSTLFLQHLLSHLKVRTGQLPEDLFGIPIVDPPKPDCMEEGVLIFRERFDRISTTEIPINTLLSIGRQSYKRRREERERLKDQPEIDPDPDVEDADPDEEPQEWVWTPEAVAGLIESIVRGAYHQIRRARFFCWLSESSLTWQLKNRQEFRTLIIQNGRVGSAETVADHSRPLCPPGFRKKQRARQRAFDVERYDLMRIYSTELRRLAEEDRPLLLRFTNGGALNAAALKQVFRWL